MPNLALEAALRFTPLPVCEKCGVKTEAETTGTDADSYMAGLRVVCPECGKASEWHRFDNYCCALPVISRVIMAACCDFNVKE